MRGGILTFVFNILQPAFQLFNSHCQFMTTWFEKRPKKQADVNFKYLILFSDPFWSTLFSNWIGSALSPISSRMTTAGCAITNKYFIVVTFKNWRGRLYSLDLYFLINFTIQFIQLFQCFQIEKMEISHSSQRDGAIFHSCGIVASSGIPREHYHLLWKSETAMMHMKINSIHHEWL